MMLCFLLSLFSGVVYLFVYQYLLGLELELPWFTELFKAAVTR